MTTETRTTISGTGLPIAPKPVPRRFHQASWDEPIIFELSVRGARGVLPPATEPGITTIVGDPATGLPAGIGRARPPALPELSQLHVLRHYDRLSQETLGVDLNIDVGQGTCTMKYSPKVNDQLIRSHKLADTHPAQDPSTVQGTLEILWRLEGMLAEISGMARVSLQPAAGSAAIWANIAMIRAWHESRGDGFDAPGGGRDEVITTIFSHPSNAAAAKVAGYRVITLYPDADGYPDLQALRAAVSERTAALLITNPEDTGIFNPRIEDWVRIVHETGGLCSYDQANANGILGITRARDAGFDVSHFNLHKTFSTPHACGGPGAGAIGVAPDLVPFLPTPTIERAADGTFRFGDEQPQSIGKVRPWHGITPNLVRAYAWIMALGAEGLREVAEIAVLNNNYLLMKVLEARGVSAPFAAGRRRIEQVRYSWEELHRDTGVTTDDLAARVIDFGTHYWMSHHPYVVPEPMTLEPTESYSREDLDAYAAILAEVAREAYEDRDHLLAAPHASTIHRLDHAPLDDPATWAITWRAYRRKHLGGSPPPRKESAP